METCPVTLSMLPLDGHSKGLLSPVVFWVFSFTHQIKALWELSELFLIRSYGNPSFRKYGNFREHGTVLHIEAFPDRWVVGALVPKVPGWLFWGSLLLLRGSCPPWPPQLLSLLPTNFRAPSRCFSSHPKILWGEVADRTNNNKVVCPREFFFLSESLKLFNNRFTTFVFRGLYLETLFLLKQCFENRTRYNSCLQDILIGK